MSEKLLKATLMDSGMGELPEDDRRPMIHAAAS
jgi:hypothetical protein